MKWAFLVLAAWIAAVFLFPGPIVSFVLERTLGTPVRVEGAHWSGWPGDWAASAVRVGPSDLPRAQFMTVSMHGVLSFLCGAPLRVRFESVHAAGESFGPSVARIKRKQRGTLIFTQLQSAAGRVRGGILWSSGRLAKAHGRVVLSDSGLSRVPRVWAKRLSSTADGPAFIAAYAGNRMVLRGRGVSIVEAAWQST